MSVEELAGIETDVEDELVDVYVANDASQAVGPITRDRQFPGDTVPVQATKVARALCILMLIVGAVNWGTARWLLNAGGPPPLGTVRHLSAWVVGWGVTLFLLGICPAETLDPDLQATIITFATWLVGIGILVVVFRTLVSLLRTPTQGSKRLPVVSFVAVITLWQATVAIALTTVAPFFHGSTFFVLKRTIRGVIPFAVPAALIVAGWGLFRYRRRTGHLPKVPFAALGLMALSALLVTGAFALDPDYLGPDCWPPVSDWEGLDGAAVNKLLNGTYNANLGDLEVTAPSVTPEARYCWALYQWRAHAGLLASPGLSLLLVAVWHSARQTRQRLQTAASQPRPSCRARWGALLHCLGRSALAMAACFLLLYLAAAPAVLRSVEDDYQRTVAYLRNPLVYWAKVREAEVAIRADATTMDGIRARVADFIARTEEESTDEEPESEP